MGKVIVVKLGGATLGNHDTTLEDIVSLQQQGWSVVVVHGGGKMITDWLEKRGIATKFIDGERVTDEATLEVVVSVLAGVVNKEIVADINALGGLAVGISGVDGAFIQGKIKHKELGYIGEVVKVDPTPLQVLLKAGYIPVVAPVSLNTGEKAPKAPRVLNINADVVAGEVAAAIGAEKLIFLTDVVGVCDQSGNLLPRLSTGEAEALMASGTASGGMIPKIKACLRALSGTSSACIIIDGRQPHVLLNEIKGKSGGTTIKK
ncbi:Acetylglutamate kinase [subsurface metagenome]